MVSNALETSYKATRNYLVFERNIFGCEDFCNVIYTQFVGVAIATIRRMIGLVARTRTNFAERVKHILRSLRWLLCATMADFSYDDDDQNHKAVVETNLDERCQGMLGTKTAEAEKLCDAVTFQSLPPECKLKVFSYLTMQEKGLMERVCSEWRDLMRTRSLWNFVDLTRLPLQCQCPGRACSNTICYDAYKDRTEHFLKYLADVQPILKDLRFAFDIFDCQDDWLRVLRSFIGAVSLQKLELAQLNWKETPVKPYPSESATWSSNNYNDLMYRHRRRQRHFVGFFDYFTASATNLLTLILPFDWSASSIRFLSRLQRLKSLVLESYFVPQPLQQEVLDDLLRGLPSLKRLTMSVCIGSGLGLATYRIASKSLRYLDLSCCQGFCLGEVCLPSLTEFRTSCCKPYVCPFVDATNTQIFAPCIYEVLCAGAPSLVCLNDHRLHPDWRENRYDELETELRNICTCPTHKVVWTWSRSLWWSCFGNWSFSRIEVLDCRLVRQILSELHSSAAMGTVNRLKNCSG